MKKLLFITILYIFSSVLLAQDEKWQKYTRPYVPKSIVLRNNHYFIYYDNRTKSKKVLNIGQKFIQYILFGRYYSISKLPKKQNEEINLTSKFYTIYSGSSGGVSLIAVKVKGRKLYCYFRDHKYWLKVVVTCESKYNPKVGDFVVFNDFEKTKTNCYVRFDPNVEFSNKQNYLCLATELTCFIKIKMSSKYSKRGLRCYNGRLFQVIFLNELIARVRKINISEKEFKKKARQSVVKARESALEVGKLVVEINKPVVSDQDSIVLSQDDVVFNEDEVVSDQDKVILAEDNVVSAKDKVVLGQDKTISTEDKVISDQDKVVLLENGAILTEKKFLDKTIYHKIKWKKCEKLYTPYYIVKQNSNYLVTHKYKGLSIYRSLGTKNFIYFVAGAMYYIKKMPEIIDDVVFIAKNDYEVYGDKMKLPHILGIFIKKNDNNSEVSYFLRDNDYWGKIKLQYNKFDLKVDNYLRFRDRVNKEYVFNFKLDFQYSSYSQNLFIWGDWLIVENVK